MKTLLLALALLLSLTSSFVQAATKAEEARFLAATKDAFAKHDVDAMVALTCWDGVTSVMKESSRKQYVGDLAHAVAEITFISADPKLPELIGLDEADVSYHWNLPVTQQLKVSFSPGVGAKEVTYPVGEKAGRLFLLAAAPFTPTLPKSTAAKDNPALLGTWEDKRPGHHVSRYTFTAEGTVENFDGIPNSDGTVDTNFILRGTYQVDNTQKPIVIKLHFPPSAREKLFEAVDVSGIYEQVSPTSVRMQFGVMGGPPPKDFDSKKSGVLTKLPVENEPVGQR